MHRPALIVVDMVNDFLAKWPESAKTRLLAATNDLIRIMRQREYPIIWVRHEFEPDLRDAFPEMLSKEIRITIRGTDGCQIVSSLSIIPSDPVVVKKGYSAFFKTELDHPPWRKARWAPPARRPTVIWADRYACYHSRWPDQLATRHRSGLGHSGTAGFVNSPAGTVQITNLTIDGTGEVGAVPCAYTDPVHPPNPIRQTTGIYSYSSIKINEVTTLGQGQNNGCGVGILAEASPANDSVTITHSLVENPSYTGIILDGEVAGSMTVSLTHNTVVHSPSPLYSGVPQAALQSSAISGEISSNTFLT